MSRILFREQFQDFVGRDLKVDFSSLSEFQRSKCMARFYAQKVVDRIQPGLVPTTEEEMAACMVDGADDCGVDFVLREAGIVLIIQAKYSGIKKLGKQQKEDPRHFEAFTSILSRLYEGPKIHRMNAKLRDAIAEIDWENDIFQLCYVTLRQPTENEWAVAKQGITLIKDIHNLQDRATLELLDEQRLNIALRDALSLDESGQKPVLIRFSGDADKTPWLHFVDDEGRDSYVGRVNGSQLAEILRAHKSQLFALNIRNYIGDNATNKSIRTTAISSPSRFYFYNNGISALATRIEADENDKDGRTLKCEALSIINGAQTVKSLLKAQGEDSVAIRGVEVLMRITEFRSKKTVGEQEFLDSVTRFNNTQNAVRTSDFRANDRIQFDLRKKFDALPNRKGRRFEYKNKRSGERDALKVFVPMEEFTKTVYSLLFGPDDVFGGTQHLFDSSKDGGYMRLFGEGGEVPPVLGEDRFRELAGIWLLCEYVKDLWREQTAATPGEGLERRWMVFYAVGESLRQVYGRAGKDVEDAFRRLCDPTWYLKEDQARPKSVLKRHFTLAAASSKNAYEKAKLNKEFTHRNWFRSIGTLESIKAELELLWPIISYSRDDYIL